MNMCRFFPPCDQFLNHMVQQPYSSNDCVVSHRVSDLELEAKEKCRASMGIVHYFTDGT